MVDIDFAAAFTGVTSWRTAYTNKDLKRELGDGNSPKLHVKVGPLMRTHRKLKDCLDSP
jgi:hypothetical protein